MDLQDFGSLQLKVLEMLWARGPSAAGDLWGAWPSKPRPAYTTVLSALQKLYRRAMVARRKQGRAHVYTPRIDRESFRRRYVTQVRDRVFSGSAAGLVAALLGGEKLDETELREIVKLIERRKDK